MFRVARVVLLAVLAMYAAVTTAQPVTSDGSLTYTFESGASFAVPDGWTLDDSGVVPTLSFDNARIFIEVVEPGFIGNTAEDTAGAPLLDVLDFLLRRLGVQGERSAANTEIFSLVNGNREIAVYGFINSENIQQTLLVIRFSNTQVGAFNVRNTGVLTGSDQAAILTIASSFDHAPLDPQAVIDAAEAELTEGFSGPHTLDSGVSFLYPPDYTLLTGSDDLPQLSLGDEIVITMVAPDVVGIIPDEPIEAIIDFAIENSDIAADDFAPLDIGGREAVIASGADDQRTQTLVLVRFADGTVGIMDVRSDDSLTPEHLLAIRGIAASFDSLFDEAASASRQANALFEDAIRLREAGQLAEAIPLFEQAVALKPDFGLAYYWGAATHIMLGNLSEAAAGYQAAANIEPNEPQIFLSLGQTLVLLNDFDGAIAAYNTAAELQGANVSAVLRNEIEIVEAVAAGEYNPVFYVNRATRYRDLGLYDLAITDLTLVLEQTPDDASLYARFGTVYDELEDYAEAIRLYTQGLLIEELPVLYYNRGIAYWDAPSPTRDVLAADSDLRCAILLGTGTLSPTVLENAQRIIDMTLITSDTYSPPVDAEQCEP